MKLGDFDHPIAIRRWGDTGQRDSFNAPIMGWMAVAPITSANDARGKLEAVLDDLIVRRDIDHLSAGIVRDVIDWLDGVVLS